MILFKQGFLLLLILVSISLHGQVHWNNSSFIHRDGQNIKDGAGNTIRLEGVNLGGWLMWEGWMWKGGFTQEKAIFGAIEEVLGSQEATNFRDSIYQNYITKDDLAHISQSCFNVVRIPFNHKLLEDDFTPYIYKEEGWRVLDSALHWCEQNNLYAILDLHSAPGGQSNLFTADPDFLINLWNGDINQTRTANLWKAIAVRYKDRGIIAGYDLLNEPDAAKNEDLSRMIDRIVDSIRVVDKNHMLFVEGNKYAADFDAFSELPDSNVVFEFHIYTWFITDVAAEIDKFTAISKALNVPMWCGEWGENSYGELQTTLELFRTASYQINGSAFWSWKKAINSSNYPHYLGIEVTPAWNKTIQWISNRLLPKPTVTEMKTGLDDFIKSIQWENCQLNEDLHQVLSPCFSTSINEIQLKNNFSVFPNPSDGHFRIENKDKDDNWSISVRNISGQIVNSKQSSTSYPSSISINGPSGIYFLDITNREGQKECLKVIKQ